MSPPAKLNRAVALIQVRGVQEGDTRKFRGTATTPEPDRHLDTLDPLGATFRNPVTLLRMHDHSSPIGTAVLATPIARGIDFTAEVPVIGEPGLLKDRTDLAWHEVKAGLVRAVSIGFIPDFTKATRNDAGGYHFPAFEIVELSTVSVPANVGATIQEVKALDAAARGLAAGAGDPFPWRLPDAEKKQIFDAALRDVVTAYKAAVESVGDDRQVSYTQGQHYALKMVLGTILAEVNTLEKTAARRVRALEARVAELEAGR